MSPDFEIFICLVLVLIFIALVVGLSPIAGALFVGLLLVLGIEIKDRKK